MVVTLLLVVCRGEGKRVNRHQHIAQVLKVLGVCVVG